ncbi:PepSY-like domain-containing protein [uncultured Microscilla sp.]|uniref:PepSY-like domain-containing protein n=1 Tax=uncultured Microscilla sp. TaxID=432653 RepID=UPI0026346B3D|nr:PepSY-like domain-containing protein [uncultured Microscilla sp.]
MKKLLTGIVCTMAMCVFTACQQQETINPGITTGSVESIAATDLPVLVLNAVHQDFSGQRITEAIKMTGTEGSVVYGVTVESHDSGNYSEGGGKCNRIELTALPKTISDYITTHYAGANVLKAAQMTDSEGTTKIMVRLDTRKALTFDASGNFLEEKEARKKGKKGKKGCEMSKESIAATDLPQPAQDYIAANYADQVTAEAYKLTKKEGASLFAVAFTHQLEVVFAVDGTFLKERTYE